MVASLTQGDVLQHLFLPQHEGNGSIGMDIGGSYATYEVITVDLKTKEIGEATDVLYATILPGGIS